MNPKYRKVLSFLLIFLFCLAKAYALDIGNIPGSLNWDCLSLRVIGTCVSPLGLPGLIIMYWEPTLLIETVKRPGDTVIESIKPVVLKLADEAAKSFVAGITGLAVPVSSGSSVSKISETNLQFNEAHVYGVPFRDEAMAFMDMQCLDKLPGASFIKYLSEVDSLEWRLGIMEVLDPRSMLSAAAGSACAATGGFANELCLGFWGPMYPRRGFFTHQSEVVASAADAVRAVSIASAVVPPGHVVLEQTGFIPFFASDKLELIYPVVSGCIGIGENPAFWEAGKLSPTGKYLWVYWRRRICCVY